MFPEPEFTDAAEGAGGGEGGIFSVLVKGQNASLKVLVKPDGSVGAELNVHTSDISIETHSPCPIFAPTETIARKVDAADGE